MFISDDLIGYLQIFFYWYIKLSLFQEEKNCTYPISGTKIYPIAKFLTLLLFSLVSFHQELVSFWKIEIYLIDWYRISPPCKWRSYHDYVDSGHDRVRKFGSGQPTSVDYLKTLSLIWIVPHFRESGIISSGSLCPRFETYELFPFIICNWYVLNKHTFSRVQYQCMVRSLQHRGNRGSCRGYNFEVSCLSCKTYSAKTIYSEENKFRFIFDISSERIFVWLGTMCMV